MRSHPFSWVNDSAKVPALITLIIFTFILTIALSSIGNSLKNEAAPLGIISFEFAGSKSQAEMILASWSDADREDAFLSLGVDYLYLFVYPMAISLACHLIATKGKNSGPIRSNTAAGLCWLVLAAIPLDALENYALIRVLKSLGGEHWPVIAKWCAVPKFGLVVLGSGYILVWLALEVLKRVRRKPKVKAV